MCARGVSRTLVGAGYRLLTSSGKGAIGTLLPRTYRNHFSQKTELSLWRSDFTVAFSSPVCESYPLQRKALGQLWTCQNWLVYAGLPRPSRHTRCCTGCLRGRRLAVAEAHPPLAQSLEASMNATEQAAFRHELNCLRSWKDRSERIEARLRETCTALASRNEKLLALRSDSDRLTLAFWSAFGREQGCENPAQTIATAQAWLRSPTYTTLVGALVCALFVCCAIGQNNPPLAHV